MTKGREERNVMEKRAGGVINFLKEVGKLKALKRAGWVRKGVSEPESVADHVRTKGSESKCFEKRCRYTSSSFSYVLPKDNL